ncbi:MAG: hypothetical protein ACJ74U_04820 [Jatrophihabitantaceae bacterium]
MTEQLIGLGRPLDLRSHFDNSGLTSASELGAGAFNIWSNTFPAEDLPAEGSIVAVGGVLFEFPVRSQGGDNIRCGGQLIELPPGRYDWLYLLAAAERHTEDLLYLHYTDGSVDPEWLRVSDFWPQTADRFGGLAAFRCTTMHYPRHIQHGVDPVIWRHRVPVPRHAELGAIRLPDNPAAHIFAITPMPVGEVWS